MTNELLHKVRRRNFYKTKPKPNPEIADKEFLDQCVETIQYVEEVLVFIHDELKFRNLLYIFEPYDRIMEAFKIALEEVEKEKL